MDSDNRRPCTRITSPQCRTLVQAFESNRLLGFATREELAQRTCLPKDKIYIWFQNRRVENLSMGRLTGQDQDLLGAPGLDGAPGGLAGRKHDGAQDSLFPLAAAGAVGMNILGSSELPAFCTESQLPQVLQASGPGETQDPTQASNTGPLELLLDEVLAEIQVEENVPAPMDQDGGPGGREHEVAQDSLLPLAEARCVGMDVWKLTNLLAFCRESHGTQEAQPP